MFDGLIKLLKGEPKRDRVEELLEQYEAGVESRIAAAKQKAKRPDPFFTAVGEHLAKADAAERPAWQQLLRHWEAANGSEPTIKWLDTANQHVETLGSHHVGACITAWLEVVNEVSIERSDNLIRGACWTSALLRVDALDLQLGAFAEACFKRVPGQGPLSRKLGNAAVWALGRGASTHAIAELSRLNTLVRYGEGLQMIDKALTSAAKRRGMSPRELEELEVPDVPSFEQVGRFWPHVRFDESGAPKLVWMRDDGKVQKSAPKELDPLAAGKVKLQFKQLQGLLPAQARRIEGFFLSQRAMPYSEFLPRYLEHSLVGLIARKLVWTFAGRAAVYFDGALLDSKGRRLEPAATDEVRLWHPLEGDTDIGKLVTWTQPFAQLERETFEPFREELESGHVHRFEGLIVSQQTFHSRCRELGWRYTLQGMWDSHNVPVRTLPGLRAELHVNPHGEDVTPAAVYQRLRVGQLVLETAPSPLVFSELLREVEQLTKGSK